MSNPKQILWTDTNSMPPHNYLWQKEDGIYTFVNGNWQLQEEFADQCVFSTNISKLTNGRYYTFEEIPKGVIEQNYGWVSIPRNLDLDDTKPYKMYVEFDGNERKEIYYSPVLKSI